MKIVRLVHCYDVWWWANMTDNDPPASNGSFGTREEAVRDAKRRVGDDIRLEELGIPKRESYSRDREER